MLIALDAQARPVDTVSVQATPVAPSIAPASNASPLPAPVQAPPVTPLASAPTPAAAAAAAEPGLPTVATPVVVAPTPDAAASTPTAAVVTTPTGTAAISVPAVDDPQFPRYEVLKPAVAFWTRVFGEYSENQSAIHSIDYPNKVFEVLDFRSDALRMDKVALSRLKAEGETKAKARLDRLLASVHELRDKPEAMNEDQRRVYQLFADVRGDKKFKDAIGTFRAQRGLKERTALALETSGRYLPEMESIFGRYRLPVRLTRLPLVESSFNVEAYSKVGAAGLWQFIPSSARIYMRLNEVVDDRRDPWTSTDAAARHLRDDYAALGSWPLALTAYNHGRGGIAKGLQKTGGSTLPDLIRGYDAKSFGFASRNFYAEFLAASDVERNWRTHFGQITRNAPVRFDTVETKNYVPYETLRRLCNADDELFRRLNPAYRPEVIEGKLYVPPGHLIRVPAGSASAFNVAYAKLGSSERFDSQKTYYLLHKISKGDTLGKIARTYGVPQASIKSANGIKDAGKLKLGQVLKVPPREERRPGPVLVAVGESKPMLTVDETAAVEAERRRDAEPRKPVRKAKASGRFHRVKSGQTLSSIAKRYKVSIAQLRNANDLGDSAHLSIGQKLKIPAAS